MTIGNADAQHSNTASLAVANKLDVASAPDFKCTNVASRASGPKRHGNGAASSHAEGIPDVSRRVQAQDLGVAFPCHKRFVNERLNDPCLRRNPGVLG